MVPTIDVSEFRFGKKGDRAEFVVTVNATSDVHVSSKSGALARSLQTSR